jgi:hypothetical protein
MKNLLILLIVCSSFHSFAQSDKDIKSAMKQSITYCDTKMKANDFKIYNIRELLHYVVRSFKLETPFALKEIIDFKPFYDDDKVIYPYFQRLHDKNKTASIDSVTNYVKNAEDLDKPLVWGIYADQLPHMDDVDVILRTYSEPSSNIRAAMHCALITKWAKDLGALNKIQDADTLRKKYTEILVNGIDKERPYTDNGIEGVLGLFILDRPDLVKKEWIESIISHQQPNGGWKWDADVNKSPIHDHTTVIALWVLAAYSAKDKNPSWFK